MSPHAPVLMGPGHRLADFSCGVDSLDTWLKRRALANQESGAARSFVACDDEDRVVAYYALASGAIDAAQAPGRFRRNMPDPIPIVILARLAVDLAHHGRGLGRALFKDAAYRVLNAADAIGIRGIVVHAISEQAKAFYETLGFDPSPVDPLTLLITLTDLRAAAEERTSR